MNTIAETETTNQQDLATLRRLAQVINWETCLGSGLDLDTEQKIWRLIDGAPPEAGLLLFVVNGDQVQMQSFAVGKGKCNFAVELVPTSGAPWSIFFRGNADRENRTIAYKDMGSL